MIEIYLLEQLLAFYECGTLSAASEKLHLAQPSLSRSMQKLEAVMEVSLFERRKNKITLNENGILAAEYAGKILEQEKEMVGNIRAFDRNRRTITVASCAPAPLDILLPLLSKENPGRMIASEIENEETLLAGLADGSYQIIILTHPLEAADYYSQKWQDEHLFITLPPSHPMAGREGLFLKALNGESILLYSQIGFWHDLCMEKMPDSRFIIQTEYGTLEELIQASSLPAFTTDIVPHNETVQGHRISISVLDPKANVNHYCICRQKEKHRLSFL